MSRKEELERLHRQSLDANGYGTPPRALRDGVPPPRRRGGGWGWLVALLLAAIIAGLSLCKSTKERLGETAGVAMPAGSVPSADGKLVNDAAVEVTSEQVKAYITPSDAEIEQLYRYVVTAPFVTENLLYSDRLKGIPFIYVATNDVVNAAAGRRVVEKDGKKSLAFQTKLLGGAARYARLVGLAAALQDAGNKDMLKKFVAAMPRRFCARCSEDDCVEFISACGLAPAVADEKIRQKAISYSSGTIVSVLAHECGHHALGHLLSFSEKTNLEIDRNQEREADSFASSVISASPFGEYIFAGTLFWHYALAIQSDSKSDASRTHPLSRERFENFVRANAEKAAAMGITLISASRARKTDKGAIDRTMEDVERLANEDVQTASMYASQTTGAHPSARRRFKTNLSFRRRMGHVAGWLNDLFELWAERVICPAAEWADGLSDAQKVFFFIVFALAALSPILMAFFLVRHDESSLKASKWAAGCSALAGAVFTVWGGFEIGGSAGELLVMAFLALMALSAIFAVIGGLWSGEGVLCKIFAPFMLLEMIIVVFVLAAIATIIFIIVVIVVITLSFAVAMTGYNTVYECPSCGRLFRGRPSSCPCGAQFS